MKKQDLVIVGLLVAALFGWIHFQNRSMRGEALQESQAPQEPQETRVQEETKQGVALPSPAISEAQTNAPFAEPVRKTDVPEKTVTLSRPDLEITLSSKGGAIVSAILPGYRKDIAKDSAPVDFDFSDAPASSCGGMEGLDKYSDFEVVSHTSTSALFRAAAGNLVLEREFSLMPDFRVDVREKILNGGPSPASLPERTLECGGASRLTDSKNEVLSVDTLPVSPGRKGKVVHWEKKGRLLSVFPGAVSGGCSGAPDARQFPLKASGAFPGALEWVAIKSRFFVVAFSSGTLSSEAGAGLRLDLERSETSSALLVQRALAKVLLPARQLEGGASVENAYSIYIGPKKYSALGRFAEKSAEIMEFGFSKWLCVILLPLLNFFNAVFRNYGVAIIALTVLVRLLFWPLTKKSNESMKKMGSIQPKIKELQEKFKDDPQKLQQETMKFYRENNINPMASCLPMLIQIPVFIALFVVLRSAVELRFAPFLWIADLSEPENLLAGAIPGVPAINILPFLMAGTMFLQSKLTPSMGDPKQQKMMMVMMPLMMFFMFYSMPSALLLYWSVSQILAIGQLVRQRYERKRDAVKTDADGVIEGETVTRQMRRKLSREKG